MYLIIFPQNYLQTGISWNKFNAEVPQQPQTQQQILKGLQAQGFAESLNQKRKPNAGDAVSVINFPTNNNATVITAKVVGGGPQ